MTPIGKRLALLVLLALQAGPAAAKAPARKWSAHRYELFRLVFYRIRMWCDEDPPYLPDFEHAPGVSRELCLRMWSWAPLALPPATKIHHLWDDCAVAVRKHADFPCCAPWTDGMWIADPPPPGPPRCESKGIKFVPMPDGDIRAPRNVDIDVCRAAWKGKTEEIVFAVCGPEPPRRKDKH